MLNALGSCEMLTAIEAAQLLKVGKRKIYDLCRSGDLPSVKLGARGLRVPLAGIHRLIDGRAESAAENAWGGGR